jgi:hypothetical protein
MMKNLILTLIITIPLTLWGQGWEQTYGGSDWGYGFSVQQTTDGGYIITGQTVGNIFLMKTDEDGNEEWNQTLSQNSYGISVFQVSDGGFITIGSSGDGTNSQILLNKTDVNGNEQWTKLLGDTGVLESVNYGELTSDGGFVITGVRGFNGYENVFLMKTDENGNELWSQINFSLFSFSSNVQQTQDGGYVLTGGTSDPGDLLLDSDIYLIKTDETGDSLWRKTYVHGFYNGYNGQYVEQTNDGGYIILGNTHYFVNESIDDGSIDGDILLLKTDENGDSLWSKTFGGYNWDVGFSIKQTTDGGFIITGSTESFGNGLTDVYLIKTDNSGNELWTKTFGGTDYDRGNSIQQTQDGGYVITGQTKSFGKGDWDIYLIKTDDQGNITSTFEIPLPNPNRKLEKTVNLKGQEIKHQTGQPIIEIFDDGSVEKKIVVE